MTLAFSVDGPFHPLVLDRSCWALGSSACSKAPLGRLLLIFLGGLTLLVLLLPVLLAGVGWIAWRKYCAAESGFCGSLR